MADSAGASGDIRIPGMESDPELAHGGALVIYLNDYVQAAKRVGRMPRQTRGTVVGIRTHGPDNTWYQVRLGDGKTFEAREDELIKLLRKEDTLA